MISRTLFAEGGLANLGLVGEVKKEKLAVQDWRGEVPVQSPVQSEEVFRAWSVHVLACDWQEASCWGR